MILSCEERAAFIMNHKWTAYKLDDGHSGWGHDNIFLATFPPSGGGGLLDELYVEFLWGAGEAEKWGRL